MNLSIRRIRKQDCDDVAAIIRTVMPEFGASGPGFAIHDPEVGDMFGTYSQERHAYFVVTDGTRVLGGGGIAPLTGEEDRVCELRKMYFLKEVRGLGLGQKIMDLCLQEAKALGFKECYLETLKGMDDAQKLYVKNGFNKICGPKGNTGHFSCDTFYLRSL